MITWLQKIGCSMLCAFVLGATVDISWSKEIGPTEDYCREINDPSSGSEITLAPGDYNGGCQIRRGGKPGLPLIVRALDLKKRPRLRYESKNGNVLEVYADHILIQGIELGPTYTDVDGIRVFAGDGITITDCVFDRMGGIAIVANHASISRATVRRNKITDSAATAMYFGCHDGEACAMSQLLIEKNFIGGVTADGSKIGYGIQLKLNSFGVIRDNVIVNTKGPGIMVYGAKELSRVSTIERNFVAGSRESSGIVIGGGPAIVRNNVAVNNNEGGIGLEDYGRRGLLRKIIVTYNTLYNNRRSGLLAPDDGPVETKIFGNAVASREGTAHFPAEREGLQVFGNQSCRIDHCFVDPANNDFTPMNGSPLFTGGNGDLSSSPLDDYFGRTRRFPPVIGAIEPPGGVIKLEIKP
jgi:Right handed beta helix region